ncbi:hypothetical protein OIU77_012158 [Salix suchowensis]|uniref:Uncharacterized protein n=1 Tax=Salix suchowensis TaxID=1278906 RepID=A0ABQ9A399_9ROSI|nr:hypothetical protein OIU77_012158 [Salix suchowensis]
MALSLPLPVPQQQRTATTSNGEIQETDIFHQFDVVSESSDHHYLDSNDSSSSKKNQRRWRRFFQKYLKWGLQEDHARMENPRKTPPWFNLRSGARESYRSLKSSNHRSRRPPKNFEGFVASHFREKASVILSACNAYSSGQARVGCYRNDGSCSSGNPSTVDVSDKFKGLMGQLYPELLLGFRRNGASLGDFGEQSVLPVEMKTVSFKGETVVRRKQGGFARMVFGKLKRVLGLKKKIKSGKSGVKKKGF